MGTPYALISDVHLHSWSAFAEVGRDGVNSRLQIILDEVIRAARALADRGGRHIFCAGDLFHVRGHIAPSVLNPALDVFESLIRDGFKVAVIPGNHDLEGRESARLSNAVTALEKVGVVVANESAVLPLDGKGVALIPWQPTVDELKECLGVLSEQAEKAGYTAASLDVIIHAPVDGVLIGIPSHGLTAEMLAGYGFGRVFAGHYHNHVDFGNGVYSVGATTHQTWSDVGTRAGFLLVGPDGVEFNPSLAPCFVDLTEDSLEGDLATFVEGHYVRARIEIDAESHVAELRERLLKQGAKGVVVYPIKKSAVVSRTGATVAAGASLSQSIFEFIREKGYSNPEMLGALCEEILVQAGSVE